MTEPVRWGQNGRAKASCISRPDDAGLLGQRRSEPLVAEQGEGEAWISEGC